MFVIAEGIINQIVFNTDVAYLNVSRDMLILIIVILWSFFVISFIAVLLKIFHEEKNRKLAIELNYAMLKKQYGQLQDDYNEKRRELHNQAHFLYLLKNLLLEGNIEQAIHHLTEKEVETTLERKGKYTGISTVDFMLNYKIKEAAKYGIAIETNLDIYFCPLEVTDMCILLGNLLDNAIEAVRFLPEDKRIIMIKMKNPNNFFLMEISNPYEGERKKKNGRYVTTKENKNIHGLGLVSVEKIVEKFEGLIEIKDADHIFDVFISLFPKQGQ